MNSSMSLRLSKILWILFATAALGYAGYHLFTSLLFPWPLEYGEGVNLQTSLAVSQGQPLYPLVSPDHLPWLHNPYPPLGPLLTSTLAGWTQPHPFFAGRLLSLIGFLMTLISVGTYLRRRLSRSATVSMLILFACNPLVLRYATLMRIDMAALGFALSAFVILDSKPSSRRFFIAALLAMSAILIKPTFCAAAVVVLIHFLRHRKPTYFLACASGALLPLLLTASWLWNRETPQLLLHLWTLQKLPWSSLHAFGLLSAWAGTYGLLIAGGLAGLFTPAKNPLRIYVLAALIPLLFTLGIHGSQDSYLLELWTILCLALGSQLPALFPQNPRALFLLASLQLLFYIPWQPPPLFTRTYGQEESSGHRTALTPTHSDRDISRKLEAEIRSRPGPVLSSSPGLVLSAGHSLTLQPFQYGALINSGHWKDDALTQAITRLDFPLIVLKGNAETQTDPYFPPATQTLIAETYSLHRVLGPWHLYLGP
jgi:hypothetical protein